MLAALFAALAAGCGPRPAAVTRAAARQPAPQRIVSLAPSITEILFALGLEPQVAGVTRYCRYPPAAVAKPKIGGYEDLSYEAVAALKPDLVVLLDAHAAPRQNLEALGFRVLEVRHERIEDILLSIETIGAACNCALAAADMVRGLRETMAGVEQRTRGLPRPRTLLTLGGLLAAGETGTAYIAGRGGFYDRLLTLAGGTNAYNGALIFPAVSIEGIVQMNPAAIVELVSDPGAETGSAATAGKRWQALAGVDAVRNGRVYVLAGDYVTIPGPRFVRVLEELARLLHPEPTP